MKSIKTSILIAGLALSLFASVLLERKLFDPKIGVRLAGPEMVDCVFTYTFQDGNKTEIPLKRRKNSQALTMEIPKGAIEQCFISGLPNPVASVSIRSPLGRVLAQGPDEVILGEKSEAGGRTVLFDWNAYRYWTLVERISLYSLAPLFAFFFFLVAIPVRGTRTSLLMRIVGTIILVLVSAAFVAILFGLGSGLSGNLDSTYFRSLLQQREWRHFGFANSGCPFEGMYTLWNSQNYSMSPSVWIAGLLSDVSSPVHNTLLYLVISAELLLSILLLGRILGTSWMTLWAVGLVALYLIFPTRGFALHQIALLNVFAMELTALGILFLCLLVVSARERPFKSAFLTSLACGAALTFLAVYDSLGIVLLIPMFTIFGLAIFWDFGWKRYLLMACFLAPITVAILLVVKGQKDFSQPGFFAQELLNDRQSLFWVSILFQNVAGGCVVGLGILGSLLGIWQKKGVVRRIFCGTIVYAAAVLVLGLIATANEDYLGPSMVYFEYPVWPFYFLGIANLVHELPLWLSKSESPSVIRADRVTRGMAFFLVVAISGYAIVGSTKPASPRDLSWDTWPPAKTEIVGKLASDLELRPGSPFQGYAYTQTILTAAQADASPYSWIAIHLLDREWVHRTGNDHRAFGLIYYGIPTLFQFGGLMSPRYYYCLSRIMGQSAKQMRSRVVANDLDPGFLKMAGVSRIISNTTLPAPFEDTGTMEVVAKGMALRLYSLPDPNLGNYSPTEVREFGEASGFIDAVRGGKIDFRREVYLERPISETLSPATSSTFSFEPGAVRVKATSQGQSLLVLPIEFSHCLRIKSVTGKPAAVFPANIVATGLLFEGEIEVVLAKRFGVFHHPLALLQDTADFRELLDRESGASEPR